MRVITMWIAKPLNALNDQEIIAWQALEPYLPLAQTLAWGRAIQAVAGQVFLIFNPEEKVGGLVFVGSENRDHFECVNGPHLHWDNAEAIPRQLATFAMAVSRLNPKFKSLSLRPRWVQGEGEERVPLLPIPLFKQTQAATWIVPLQNSSDAQFQFLSRRLQRTLKLTQKAGVEVFWEKVTLDRLAPFVNGLRKFGASHYFTVPPQTWFNALTQTASLPGLGFWLATAQKKISDSTVAFSQLLVCIHGDTAHYLFGYEQRPVELKSSISTSAAAHWEALERCREAGLKKYDLNGYILDVQPDNPYYGVCQFKAQFSGHAICYDVPEFLIQSGL